MSYKEIEFAREFFNIKDYPGNFFEHIKREPDFIDKYNILLFKQYMGKTSGFIGYADDNMPIICINYKRNIGHQNFSLAHEIGHLFLHKGLVICDTTEDIDGRTKTRREQEANEFAAELIYPMCYVKEDCKYIMQNNLLHKSNVNLLGDYLNDLCKKYCISFSCALYRILFNFPEQCDINKIASYTKRKVGKLSDKYEPFLHVVVPEHYYFQPYSFPLNVLKENVEKLQSINAISKETGQAIIKRNMELEA